MIGPINPNGTEKNPAADYAFFQKTQSEREVPKLNEDNEDIVSDVLEIGGDAESRAVLYAKLDIHKPVAPEVKMLLRKAETAANGNLRSYIETQIRWQLKILEAREQERLEGRQGNAAGLISEDGLFGAKAASGRIVQFAAAVSDGNRASCGALQKTVETGFSEACEVMGGELPELLRQTWEETLRGLDEWGKPESAGKADAPLPAKRTD